MSVARNYWLWLGYRIEYEKIVSERPALSVAANRWQKRMLDAVMAAGEDVVVVGYWPEPVWPKGKLLMPGGTQHGVRNVAYLNVPFVRSGCIAASLAVALAPLFAKRGLPEAVLTYNAPPAYSVVGRALQRTVGVPWIAVMADVYDNEGTYDQIADAAGRLFFAYSTYVDCPHEPKIHLEGGVTALQRAPDVDALFSSQKKSFLCTGATYEGQGADLLAEAFTSIVDPNLELWMTGKNIPEAVRKIASRDSRIRILGLVSEAELEARSRAAFAFVSPARPSFRLNKNNFPSKIFEYLAYQKPVISTVLPGIAPEYDEVLVYVRDEGAIPLADQIRSVAGWDRTTYERNAERIAQFIRAKRLWSVQARRLSHFVREDVVRAMNGTARAGS